MDISRKVMVNFKPGERAGMGPMNSFSHHLAFPDADFREVVRPNFDTLYSMAWLDLSDGPVIVSAPDTKGRYFLLEMVDMWSDVFAVPGKRTSGTKPGHWAVVPPFWSGTLPDGVSRIDSPTVYVWIIGRTQTNGPADYEEVHAVQEGFTITPLARWGKRRVAVKASIDPSVDMKTPPMVQVDTLPASRFFSYGAELMKMHLPHVTDWSQVARLARIGIEPGKSFDLEAAPAPVREALERAVTDSLGQMRRNVSTIGKIVNGWLIMTDNIGVYGNSYQKRAIVAMIGLGANQPEDAIYPLNLYDSDGKALDGSERYVLHFAREQLPPVDAFWSLTMYDDHGFPVANKLDRFAIGDRDKLVFGKDGSLDIYIQSKSPGGKMENNWLPSPAKGTLGVTMRLYAPRRPILDGSWTPPAIRRV
jgi:hypothetical protein